MILVTGGAGYIGSHTCIELMRSGYELIVLDNFCNSSLESLKRVEKIIGVPVEFVKGDVRDLVFLRTVFLRFNISSVVHFAGLKSVRESMDKPLMYYDNNVSASLALLKVMAEFKCKKLIFSSSATVYGGAEVVPISEDSPLSVTNPYGRSKLMVEEVLRDLSIAQPDWSIIILRYFNPIGAHKSGLIGEDPNGIPNNLMPYVSQVAVGQRAKLSVFGGDYNTDDGTGVRDYIHVVDLAKGHVQALEVLQRNCCLFIVNLGTGRGYSVLDMVKAFEKASGRHIPYDIVGRRIGDVAQCYADPSRAQELMGWSAEYDIDRMCEDIWRWQFNNPKGYQN